MSKRPTGSLLGLGVPELTEFGGRLPLLERNCHHGCRSCCHSTVLDELVQDVLPRSCVHSSGESTRGAIANEGYECSATSGRSSILNSSVASHRDVSYWNRRRPAWPESQTELCQEIRSFQCRCVWDVSPCNATVSDSWKVAPPLDAKHNPDFNVRNPVFIPATIGLLLEGRVAILQFSLRPSTDNTLQTKFAQGQNRGKDVPSASSPFCDRAQLQDLRRDVFEEVSPTCLDGTP